MDRTSAYRAVKPFSNFEARPRKTSARGRVIHTGCHYHTARYFSTTSHRFDGDGTMDKAALYDDYVALIADGFTPLERTARQLATTNGFPIGPLERALDEAFTRLMDTYIREIAGGRVAFASHAYAIARERQYPTDAIDAALARVKTPVSVSPALQGSTTA